MWGCAGIIEINPQIVRYVRRESNGAAQVTCQRPSQDTTWQVLIETFDIDTFNALPERIGCPGCIDLPFEWIEIETDTSKHSVTFNSQTPPPALRNLYDRISALDSGGCAQ